MERGSAVWGGGGEGGRGKVSPRLCRNAAQPRERLPVGMGLGEPLRLDPTAPRGVTGTERGRTVAEPGPVGRWEEPLSPRPAAAAPQRPAVLFPPLPSTDGGPEGGSIPPPPPSPPTPRAQQEPASPQPPTPSPPTNQQEFGFFCFLIGFKHNKLLIEGGGGDGVGGHRLLSKEEAELRGRVSTQRMELLPHGGLKITKGMGDVKGGRWGAGEVGGGGGGERNTVCLLPARCRIRASVLPQPPKELSAFSSALPWVLHTAWGAERL